MAARTEYRRRWYHSHKGQPAANPGPLRRAYDNRDLVAFQAALLDGFVQVDAQGCWIWTGGRNEKGYAVRSFDRSRVVHRLLAEFAGWDIAGKSVHHKCGRGADGCVNLDHLQSTSHRDNQAEMVLRQWYVSRIVSLEAALREVSPGHPALEVHHV